MDASLGTFAYKVIDEKCEQDYKASEHAVEKPLNLNRAENPTNPAKSTICAMSNKTIVTAQAYKGNNSYDYSYTITACKEDINYDVYLKNRKNYMLKSGRLIKEQSITENKKIVSDKIYGDICVWVSDNTINNNGLFCNEVIV